MKDCELPDDCNFDYTFNLTLTSHHTKQFKAMPFIKYIDKKQFNYLDENGFYTFPIRVVRIELSENTYEYIYTNLPAEQFDVDSIKEIYHLRWGIESSFRELKYAIGTTHFHSKKNQHICQEIFAKLILYNFCEIIITHVAIQKKQRKHGYQLNFTVAICICKHFLKSGDIKSPLDVEALIQKELLPIRAHRKCPRKVNHKAPVSFLYRVA